MVNTLYPPLVCGGAERSVSLLAEGLARGGDEVSVISLHPGRSTIMEERNGVRVYRVPLANVYWPFGRGASPNLIMKTLWHLLDVWNRRAAREVGRILDIERPDIVHTNTISGFSISVFREVKRRKIRLVHTLRDYYMLCDRYTLFRGKKTCDERCIGCRLLSMRRGPASLLADAVVANSAYVLKMHERHGAFRGVPGSVIYNISSQSIKALSVELSDRAQDAGWPPPPENVDASSRGHGQTGKDTLIFGFIGRVEAEKGISVILAATKLLTRGNWRLRIAGSGLDSFITPLRQQYADRRIEWLGFTDSAGFYPSVDVCLISSVWAEPLPRTLIECFAAGKSAICARSGGIMEIASLGKVVASYEAEDALQLASLMDAAMLNIGRWRGGGWLDEGASRVFSEEVVTQRYRDVYRGKPVSPPILLPGYQAVIVEQERAEEMV
ncbi:MAG TPA: glycosyltransferase family 4 protein [Acidisarcina sp.]